MSESDCDWAIPRFEGLDEVLAGHGVFSAAGCVGFNCLGRLGCGQCERRRDIDMFYK